MATGYTYTYNQPTSTSQRTFNAGSYLGKRVSDNILFRQQQKKIIQARNIQNNQGKLFEQLQHIQISNNFTINESELKKSPQFFITDGFLENNHDYFSGVTGKKKLLSVKISKLWMRQTVVIAMVSTMFQCLF
jgi:hypothetical protein